MKHIFPKVLVCAPQYDGKNYCFEAWAERVKSLTYPNFEVFLADNSKTKDNVELIKSHGFNVKHIDQNPLGAVFTLRDAHNACITYMNENDFEYMLHLETDVFPPLDVIESLLSCRKQICAGTYDIKQGSNRLAMIQTDEPFHTFVNKYRVIEMVDQQEPVFFDGKVKKVFHAGLGCILIHSNVFKSVIFEADQDVDVHPDTIFASRCFENDIPIYVDTNICCDHLNTIWT